MNLEPMILALVLGLVQDAPAATPVDYLRDVKPILAARCYELPRGDPAEGGPAPRHRGIRSAAGATAGRPSSRARAARACSSTA